MTGRLVDMSFTLGGKQRVTLEVNGDFRETWDKLHLEPVLDIEVKKHREKRSLSANAYFHVLVNKIATETGESDDEVKRRLVVSYGAIARDKDGHVIGIKLPAAVDATEIYQYVRYYETRQENGKDFACYFVYKDTHRMDTKEFAHLVDGAITEAKELGIQTDTPATYRSQQPQQMGFATQNQRQQWQGANAAPEVVQPAYSQGEADDFSVIDDSDDLPF